MAALWLLNLDAELEWTARRKGPSYAPTREVQGILDRAFHLASGLCAAGDHCLSSDLAVPPTREPWVGRAFCPTPKAQEHFSRLGIATELWPDLAIVERVNDRSFAFEQGLAPKACLRWTELNELQHFLNGRRRDGDWLAKRALGTAGRGQRALRSGRLTEADRLWLQASLEVGAVFLEPRRRILSEYSLHGRLHPRGQFLMGQPLIFSTKHGAFQSARLAPSSELDGACQSQMQAAFEKAATRLHAAGYFGPFGIDAYRFEECGMAKFEACSEINARYTLAWPLGMESAGAEARRPYSWESDECSNDAELMQ